MMKMMMRRRPTINNKIEQSTRTQLSEMKGGRHIKNVCSTYARGIMRPTRFVEYFSNGSTKELCRHGTEDTHSAPAACHVVQFMK